MGTIKRLISILSAYFYFFLVHFIFPLAQRVANLHLEIPNLLDFAESGIPTEMRLLSDPAWSKAECVSATATHEQT